MNNRLFRLSFLCLLPLPLAAQAPEVPNMDHEPHHHLVMQNEFVKVFDVRVTLGDSIILHSHDRDTVAIAVGEQTTTIGVPGKPDVHQKSADGQIRLQRSGYVHSTHVDAGTYHTVAVELMKDQANSRNLCVEVLAGQPLNCPAGSEKTSAAGSSKPLLATDQTQVSLVTVHPHQSLKPADFSDTAVVVALDSATVGPAGKEAEKALQPGDFAFMEGGHGRSYQNKSDKDARFIQIAFPAGK